MANKWLMHVKKTMKTMKSRGTYKKGDGLKKVIMEAKKSYKKHKGGAEHTDSSSSSSDDTAAAAPAAAPAATPEVKPDAPAPPTAMGGRRKRGTRRTRRLRK
jgi:hypothetical protein